MKRLIFLLALCGLLTGCAASARPAQPPERLQVVATLFPYYDFARAVAGGAADVTLLLSPGREAHSFEPTPLDVLTVADCGVFLYNGGEGEAWVEKLLDSSGCACAVRLMDFAETREEVVVEGMQVREEEEEDSDEVEYDEHVWTSPANARLLLAAVCDALCAADAENEALYRANAAAYDAQLAELDARFRTLRGEAVRDLLVFGDRFPFLYFCEEYGLRYRAAFHGCSSETEPSLRTLKYLIDRVNEENIPVVYTVDLDSPRIAEAIAESTGAAVRTLYSGQTVSRADFAAGETYLTLMERNLSALRDGLL